jgi:hypothetical protein
MHNMEFFLWLELTYDGKTSWSSSFAHERKTQDSWIPRKIDLWFIFQQGGVLNTYAHVFTHIMNKKRNLIFDQEAKFIHPQNEQQLPN